MANGISFTVVPSLWPSGGPSGGVSVAVYLFPNGGPWLTVSGLVGASLGDGRPVSIEVITLAPGVSSADTLWTGGSTTGGAIYQNTESYGSDGSVVSNSWGLGPNYGISAYKSFTIPPIELGLGVISSLIVNPSAYTMDAAGAAVPNFESPLEEYSVAFPQPYPTQRYIDDRALIYLGDPLATSPGELGSSSGDSFASQPMVLLPNGELIPALDVAPASSTQDSIQRFLNETSSTEPSPEAAADIAYTVAPSGSSALDSPGVAAVLGMTGDTTIGAESAVAQDYANASVEYSGTYAAPSDMNFRIDDSYYYYEYPDFSSVEYAYTSDYSNIDINAGYSFGSNQYYSPDVYASSQNSGSGYGFSGYVDSSTGSFGGSVSFAFPVVLDLNGDGISITERTASNTYRDVNGDGTEHRTAWAAAGDGVLVYDYTGTGDVDSPQAFQFTTWDPTATSDMPARG